MDSHAFKGRREDRRYITGAGTYTSDRNLPGQLHACFLRADRAHAEIRSLDASAARSMRGVHLVLTGEDIKAAGINSLPTQLAVNGRDGKPLLKPYRPALAQGKVRYVGEPICCVVAETAELAQDAAERIAIDFHDLPHVTRAVDAMKPGAPQLHDNVPGNRVFDWGIGDEAKTDEVFRAAKRVVKLTLYNNRVVANPMEPRTAIGHYDAARDHYTHYSVTQGVNLMRVQLAAAMGVAEDKLSVVAQDVGGGFGVRSQIYPEYPTLLLASKKTGRPVKWTASRTEVFLADEQGRDVVSTGEVALDERGRFLAMRFNFLTNLGGYCAPSGPFINMRATAPMTGVYDVPVAYARNQMFLTNTAPMAAYRGAGRPIMSSIVERLVGQAARELGMDPAEIRRRNMIPRDKFPYKLVNDMVYDCGDPIAVMEDAVRATGWDDTRSFEARRAEARKHGKLLGRGMACCIESTAGMGGDEVELRFDEDGKLMLYTMTHALGIPEDKVQLREGDFTLKLIGGGTGGSRSTHGAGSALYNAAQESIRKGMALAAHDLEAAEADIEFADGAYRIKGTDRKLMFEALVKKHAKTAPHPLNARKETKTTATWPNGCHIAEVEIDEKTGVIEILSYVACDDAGNIINHTLVEGQMHGGLTNGAGQVLGEYANYDPETGQLLSASFMDYPLPKAGLWKEVRLLDHPVPTQTNPLGAKGVGEAGVTGSLPTLMNAILDALAPAGVTHLDMPATPGRVWAAIQMAKAGKPAALALPQT
jgi:carbon-monoxide dehydrogenase large subunit